MKPEKIALIVYTIIFSVIIIRYIVGKIASSNIIEKIKRKNKFELETDSENLIFLNQYTYYGGYSTEERLKIEPLSKIMEKCITDTKNNVGGVVISSKFNGIYYAMFDLDNQQNFELFKKIYAATPYVIFQSSPNHYWGLLDVPYIKLADIYNDTNWKVCNDQNYISFTKMRDNMLIRGLYENLSRKPRLSETNGNLSKNFQLFIDKLTKYYNKEALELSVLRYKDPTMLIQFNRKRKIQQLNNTI